MLVLTAVVASGCLQDGPPPPPTATPTFTPEAQQVNDNNGQGDQPEAVPPSAEAVPEATPFDLSQLHATDPATVELASGRPMLLEFFAFW